MPQDTPLTPLELAHQYLVGAAIDGAESPEYREVDGISCVQLKIRRPPNLSATLCFGLPDGRLKIWSDVQLAEGVPHQVGDLIRDLFELERHVTKIVLFHTAVGFV